MCSSVFFYHKEMSPEIFKTAAPKPNETKRSSIILVLCLIYCQHYLGFCQQQGLRSIILRISLKICQHIKKLFLILNAVQSRVL